MSTLQIDFETRATVDLREAGVYVYAQHPDTDIWCMAWAFDDEEVEIWTPGVMIPNRILSHIAHNGEVRAWNAQFERTIWREVMTPRYGAPRVNAEQWVCTAAEAAAMALPRSLDQAAKVLGVNQTKDTEGYGLMMRLTRPRKIVDGRPVWWDNTDGKLDRLYAYCKQDVRTERAVKPALRRLTPKEREIYLLDQRMNDRGIHIDRALILAAKDVVEEGRARANATLGQLTDGLVPTVTNNGKLTAWVRAQGVETDGVSKPAIQEMMESDLDPRVREVLQLRSDAGRSSVAKLDSMLACADGTDAVRGLLLYHGASTGRWSGKLIQPQNFPRGEVKDPERFIPDVLGRKYDFIDCFAHPIVVVSSMLRSMLVAKPGHDLIAGDYSAIEARVVNWLAGQDDVLDLFRRYDAGEKSCDPYVVMARRMGEDVTRQTGKAAELGCGFQMGSRKFVTAAWDVYQVRVTPKQAIDAVRTYRQSHPEVVDFWYATEAACLKAIAKPGEVQVFGGRQNLKVVVAGAYLYIILPSGRPLCYAAPKAVERTITTEVLQDDGSLIETSFTKIGMEYSGADSKTKQWGRQRAYGGFLVENITQAVARDIMAEAMLRLDKSSVVDPLLSVHDEIIGEIPDFDTLPLRDFEAFLAEAPAWAVGLPIKAEGWRDKRYRK